MCSVIYMNLYIGQSLDVYRMVFLDWVKDLARILTRLNGDTGGLIAHSCVVKPRSSHYCECDALWGSTTWWGTKKSWLKWTHTYSPTHAHTHHPFCALQRVFCSDSNTGERKLYYKSLPRMKQGIVQLLNPKQGVNARALQCSSSTTLETHHVLMSFWCRMMFFKTQAHPELIEHSQSRMK